MALDYTTELPSNQYDAADADYPNGRARDVTASGQGDGSPWRARQMLNYEGFFQRLLLDARITPNGNPDTVLVAQYFDAMMAITGAPKFTAATLSESTVSYEAIPEWTFDVLDGRKYAISGGPVIDGASAGINLLFNGSFSAGRVRGFWGSENQDDQWFYEDDQVGGLEVVVTDPQLPNVTPDRFLQVDGYIVPNGDQTVTVSFRPDTSGQTIQVLANSYLSVRLGV